MATDLCPVPLRRPALPFRAPRVAMARRGLGSSAFLGSGAENRAPPRRRRALGSDFPRTAALPRRLPRVGRRRLRPRYHAPAELCATLGYVVGQDSKEGRHYAV